MKKTIYMLSAAVCVIALAGCGQKPEQAGTVAPEKTIEEVSEEKPAADTEDAGEKIKEETGKTEDIEEVSAEESEDNKETAEEEPEKTETGEDEASENAANGTGVFADAFDKKIVYENGSYFVRIGNKVYFRNMDPASMDEGAIFGNFLSTENKQVECALICYDIKTCEWKEAGKITGIGELYACPEGFYIMGTDPDNPNNYITYLYDPQKNEQVKYCDGMPLGISESGQILAVDRLTDGSYHPALVKNGEYTGSFGDQNTYYEFCGFAGEDIVVAASDDDADKKIFYSGDETGELTRLGALDGSYMSLPTQEQFIPVGKDIYQSFGYYEGTGNFLSNWVVTKATCGVEGSLQTIPDEYFIGTEMIDNVPRIYINETGEVCDAEHLPYEPYMGNEENRNNLYYNDDVFDQHMLVRDFINNSYSDKCSIIQNMIQTGDNVFVIYADAETDPEYDIGWRTGYRMEKLHICAIPLGNEHLGDDGLAKDIINFTE